MHICKPKFDNNRPTNLVAAAISMDPKIKSSQIQENAVFTVIQKRKSWNEVEKVAKQVTDKRAILNETILDNRPQTIDTTLWRRL